MKNEENLNRLFHEEEAESRRASLRLAIIAGLGLTFFGAVYYGGKDNHKGLNNSSYITNSQYNSTNRQDRR